METQELVLSDEAFTQIKEKFFDEISKANNELSVFEKSLEKKNKQNLSARISLSARRGWGLNDISGGNVLNAANMNELCQAVVYEIKKTKQLGMSNAVKAANADNQAKMYTEKITDLQEENEKLQKKNEELDKQLEYDENDPYNKLWNLCYDFDYDHSHSPVNAFSRMLECYLVSSKDDPQVIVNTVADANKTLQHLESIRELVKE